MPGSSRAAYRRLLLTYLRPLWPALLLLSLFLIANVGLQLLNPWIAKSFIDEAQAGVPAEAITVTATPRLHQVYTVHFLLPVHGAPTLAKG